MYRGAGGQSLQAAPLGRPACTGGQGTLPKLQNTQQSPDFGFMRAPQPGQSQKNRHASVGIVSTHA